MLIICLRLYAYTTYLKFLFFENYFLVKIFMLECMPIYDVFLFCSKLFGPFRGKVVQNCLFGATTHKYIDFTALNAGIRWERKIYFWHHLYHRDHGGRLIPASYVVPKINQYIFFTFGPLFGSKSASCCDPYCNCNCNL